MMLAYLGIALVVIFAVAFGIWREQRAYTRDAQRSLDDLAKPEELDPTERHWVKRGPAGGR